MIEICTPEKCCGCGACEDICPNQCIKMRQRGNGFLYPEVDTNRCCGCQLCRKTCPEYEIQYMPVNPTLYAAYALDTYTYSDGSSGGVFGLLSKEILSQGGRVYGAAFDEQLNLRHIGINDEEQLSKLFKSKYIQSDTSFIFRAVLKDLNTGNVVLFSGTPCQCAALRKYLRRDFNNLVVVDILCHGVPSSDLWKKSLKSFGTRHGGIITNFQFRSKPPKRKLDHYFSMTIKKSNGREKKILNRPSWEFPFYYHYTQYYGLRKTCYDCAYATPSRMGDITLADFWKLDQLIDVDPERFVSAVITNTEKGEQLFSKIKTQCWYQQMPLSSFKLLNPTYTKGTVKTEVNQNSLRDLEVLSFSDYEKKYMILKRDLLTRGLRFIKRIYHSR